MVKIIRLVAVTLVFAALPALAAVGSAQEKFGVDNPARTQPKPTLVPLKLQLVLSRYQGDKKISSVPYVLWLTANEPSPTKLRMGVQVPIPSTTFGSTNAPISSYTLKDVGTNIDCSATTANEGSVYRLNLTVSDNGVNVAEKAGADGRPVTLPSYRNFTSTFTILLRDGQTGQYTSATDPVSGEVLKIDATLNVLK